MPNEPQSAMPRLAWANNATRKNSGWMIYTKGHSSITVMSNLHVNVGQASFRFISSAVQAGSFRGIISKKTRRLFSETL